MEPREERPEVEMGPPWSAVLEEVVLEVGPLMQP